MIAKQLLADVFGIEAIGIEPGYRPQVVPIEPLEYTESQSSLSQSDLDVADPDSLD
ncbi:hypothetical protein [Halobaculum roseum]|uniref:hypothetical protein n=1 Tax=Halobaculum roseum TaxID=2175149 RepID=UPI001CA3CF9A|nr:hypothetical protein [Halobaculum roseum]QZY01923.1 hypothetical protein K6T36_11440 [Halobaculum roseum]